MNPEIKQKWINALRSGMYTQGKDALRTETGYCCLGVLCDVYVKETGKGYWGEYSTELKRTPFNDGEQNNSSVTIPNAVRKWAGLKEISGEGACPVEILHNLTAAYANDVLEMSFDDIAHTLETGTIKNKYYQKISSEWLREGLKTKVI